MVRVRVRIVIRNSHEFEQSSFHDRNGIRIPLSQTGGDMVFDRHKHDPPLHMQLRARTGGDMGRFMVGSKVL